MEAASPLSELLAPQVGAIFQDAVDQLAVLGALAPPEEGGSSRGDSGGVLGDEVGSIVQEQRELERKYDAVSLGSHRLCLGGAGVVEKGKEGCVVMEPVSKSERVRPVHMYVCVSAGEKREEVGGRRHGKGLLKQAAHGKTCKGGLSFSKLTMAVSPWSAAGRTRGVA